MNEGKETIIKQTNSDNLLRLNRFLVRFPNELNIPEWWINKCKVLPRTKRLIITICSIIDNTRSAILTQKTAEEFLHRFNRIEEEKRIITIQDLSPFGTTVTKATYKNCQINCAYMSNPYDYSDNGVKCFDFIITFEELEEEILT